MLTSRICILAITLAGAVHGTTFGTNLIVNGDAESFTMVDPLTTDGIADFAGWTRTGDVFRNTYMLHGNFVYITDPGTEAFGSGYFLGGDQASTQLTQSIFIGDQSVLIDSGLVDFQLRGWMTAARQSPTGAIDTVTLGVRFLDGLGHNPGGTGIASPDQAALTLAGSPVTAQQYSDLRVSVGVVPTGTRSLDVSMAGVRRGELNFAVLENHQ